MRERESFCANSFDKFLVENLKFADKKWEPVEEGQDPPDCFLVISGITFAVEITSTEVVFNSIIGSDQIIQETYHYSQAKFIEELREEAKNKKILRGTYIVHFYSPMAGQPNFKKVKKFVSREILKYIEQSQNEVSRSVKVIEYGNDEYGKRKVCSIHKFHNENNSIVEAAFSDVAWVNSQEVKAKACQILQSAIKDKKQAFLKKSKMDPKVLSFPRILLLLNTYGFASQSMYLGCIKYITDIDFFHSVFIIQENEVCFPLFISDPTWARKS